MAPNGYIRATDPFYTNLEENGFEIDNEVLSVYELDITNQQVPATGDEIYRVAMAVSVTSFIALADVIWLKKKYE